MFLLWNESHPLTFLPPPHLIQILSFGGRRLPHHGWEVTTSVPAGPAQAAHNVEHLELEL